MPHETKRCADYASEVEHLRRQLAALEAENQRLQADLETQRHEHQALHREVERAHGLYDKFELFGDSVGGMIAVALRWGMLGRRLPTA